MRLPDFRKHTTRQRAWTAATLLLLVLLATHPELRLLMPLVDAIGVDTLLLIVGLQVLDLLGPLPYFARDGIAHGASWLDRVTARVRWLRDLRDIARYAVFNWIDPRAWRRLHEARLALQRPVARVRSA